MEVSTQFTAVNLAWRTWIIRKIQRYAYLIKWTFRRPWCNLESGIRINQRRSWSFTELTHQVVKKKSNFPFTGWLNLRTKNEQIFISEELKALRLGSVQLSLKKNLKVSISYKKVLKGSSVSPYSWLKINLFDKLLLSIISI